MSEELEWEMMDIFESGMFAFPIYEHKSARKIVRYLLYRGVLDEEIADAIEDSTADLHIWLKRTGKYMVGEWVIAWINDCREEYKRERGEPLTPRSSPDPDNSDRGFNSDGDDSDGDDEELFMRAIERRRRHQKRTADIENGNIAVKVIRDGEQTQESDNFQPLEVVDRGSEAQPHVVENSTLIPSSPNRNHGMSWEDLINLDKSGNQNDKKSWEDLVSLDKDASESHDGTWENLLNLGKEAGQQRDATWEDGVISEDHEQWEELLSLDSQWQESEDERRSSQGSYCDVTLADHIDCDARTLKVRQSPELEESDINDSIVQHQINPESAINKHSQDRETEKVNEGLTKNLHSDVHDDFKQSSHSEYTEDFTRSLDSQINEDFTQNLDLQDNEEFNKSIFDPLDSYGIGDAWCEVLVRQDLKNQLRLPEMNRDFTHKLLRPQISADSAADLSLSQDDLMNLSADPDSGAVSDIYSCIPSEHMLDQLDLDFEQLSLRGSRSNMGSHVDMTDSGSQCLPTCPNCCCTVLHYGRPSSPGAVPNNLYHSNYCDLHYADSLRAMEYNFDTLDQDCPGYIFIMTDSVHNSLAWSAQHAYKIASSRKPERCLLEFQSRNIDIELIWQVT